MTEQKFKPGVCFGSPDLIYSATTLLWCNGCSPQTTWMNPKSHSLRTDVLSSLSGSGPMTFSNPKVLEKSALLTEFLLKVQTMWRKIRVAPLAWLSSNPSFPALMYYQVILGNAPHLLNKDLEDLPSGLLGGLTYRNTVWRLQRPGNCWVLWWSQYFKYNED